MKSKKKTIWIAAAVAAALVLALVIWLCARPGTGAPEPAASPTPDAQETQQPDVEETPQPGTVGDGDVSRVTTDTEAGTPWKTMTDDTYSVSVTALGGYDGLFIEDGSDEPVTGVLALQFRNDGSQAIAYAEYVFRAGEATLSFQLSNLPAGESAVVLEAGRHAYDSAEALKLTDRLVAFVDELTFASDQVLLVDNSDNSLTLMNLTDRTLPVVRVFYKYWYEDEQTFVGGITYTAKGRNIPAGGSVTIRPSHYVSDGRVLMGSGVYDE